jgi:hypothetical protein
MGCDKVKIWASISATSATVKNIEVDVYYSGVWNNIYSGSLTEGSFVEYPLSSTQFITSIRIREQWTDGNFSGQCRIYEVYFNQVILPPAITILEATNSTFKGSTLNSNVTDDGGDTVCQVRYGYGQTTQLAADFESYTTKSAWVDGYHIGNPAPLPVTGLALNTVYYYRAQVKNTVGTATSDEAFFTTAAYTQLQSWDLSSYNGTTFNPDQPAAMFDESGPKFPGGTLPDETSDAGGVPRSVFWTIIPLIFLCLAGIGTFQVTNSLLAQALVLIFGMAIVMSALLHAWPLYLIVPMILESGGILLSSKVYGY